MHCYLVFSVPQMCSLGTAPYALHFLREVGGGRCQGVGVVVLGHLVGVPADDGIHFARGLAQPPSYGDSPAYRYGVI